MIDKLSLTCNRPPAYSYLERYGDTSEDEFRRRLYKYVCELQTATVFYKPHKFGQELNDRINFTKVDINPKRFSCFWEMWAYLDSMFRDVNSEVDLSLEEFNVTRVDIAVDLEDFNIKHILSSLHVKNIRDEGLSFYKGTIYAGTDPKIRIYNKIAEIKNRLRKKKEITAYERGLLESGKDYTRFEIQKRTDHLNLKRLSETCEELSSYFDRMEFFALEENCSCAVMQFVYKQVNRKFRDSLERFKNLQIIPDLKARYIESVRDWFAVKEPF
jgi:cobalamin biosynthesis Mg chelatase CobN